MASRHQVSKGLWVLSKRLRRDVNAKDSQEGRRIRVAIVDCLSLRREMRRIEGG